METGDRPLSDPGFLLSGFLIFDVTTAFGTHTMTLTITNQKSAKISKSDFVSLLRDFLRVNHVKVPEDVSVSFLVANSELSDASDETAVVQISWIEAEND